MKRNLRQAEGLDESEHLISVCGYRQSLVISIEIRVDLTNSKGPSTVKEIR